MDLVPCARKIGLGELWANDAMNFDQFAAVITDEFPRRRHVESTTVAIGRSVTVTDGPGWRVVGIFSGNALQAAKERVVIRGVPAGDRIGICFSAAQAAEAKQ